MKKHPLYRTWIGMKERCNNPNRHDYHLYGGKGIKVCDRWKNDFAAFVEDMGEKPSPKYSIDRFPNGNGNYEPGNCRWATTYEQIMNSSFNKPKLTKEQRVQIFERLSKGEINAALAKEYSVSKSLVTRISKHPEIC